MSSPNMGILGNSGGLLSLCCFRRFRNIILKDVGVCVCVFGQQDGETIGII
jgi:hypothetical protein